MEISSSNIINNFLYFLKTKLFMYFRKQKPGKNSLYFRKQNFLIFQEVAFRAQKMKKTHFGNTCYISEMELSGPKPTKLLFFKENPLGLFITVFQVFSFFTTAFYHCFSGVFIVDCICSCQKLSLS